MDENSLLRQKCTSEHWLKKLSSQRKILYCSEVTACFCFFFFFGFFFGCCGSLLLHEGFSPVAESRGSALVACVGFSVCWRRSPPFSCCRAQALKRSGFSSCSTQLGSCDTWAYLPCSMWNLLDQGSNPRPLQWQMHSYPLCHWDIWWVNLWGLISWLWIEVQ